jgi:hypothetical protein
MEGTVSKFKSKGLLGFPDLLKMLSKGSFYFNELSSAGYCCRL